MLQSFMTTGIGSLPHLDPSEACKIIFEFVDIPFWPQLPHRSFHELMVPQYSEGFPFVKIEGEDIYVAPAGQDEVSAFYEAVAAGEGFPVSEEYAAGLYKFLEILSESNRKYGVIKGHITGPLTFTLSLTDKGKRPMYFDEEMRELALELLKGKVKWQVKKLSEFAESVLIFVDEPILSALGTSAYIGVSTDEAGRMLKEIVTCIKDFGGIAGIHCCGKADWPLVLSSGVDVFNYDSYFFWDSLAIYPDEVAAFINGNGFIASGIIPTTDIIRKLKINDVKEQFERGIGSLEKLGIPGERLRKQLLITPSCGTGSLNTDDTMKVFTLLKQLRNLYAGD